MSGYLGVIMAAYFLIVAFGYWLDFLNLSHLRRHGSVIPPEFVGNIDQELLSRTRDYIVENTKFGFVSSLFQNIVLLLFLFVLMNSYNSWVVSLQYPFIISGLIFFIVLSYASTVISMPFSLYGTFRIENKYGFNTMTLKLWIADTVKSLLISTVLMALLISVGLLLIEKSPELWWFWVWTFFVVFGIFIMYISPYVIEPLFHKFTPVDNEELESGIRDLMEKVGIRVSRVFQIDASKRTRHTNAYFTGIGRVKRIVLYDTLIEKMTREEILAVLAHEAGHWKKKHILKHILLTESIALVALYVSFRLVQGDFLIRLFEVDGGSFFSKLIILGFLGSIVSFPFSPLFHYISRKHEHEADRYSLSLTGDSGSMIGALVKLSKDNLSNLHPHPMYALFHYSHPPVLKRIQAIREMAGE